uniref:Uncharacterized protein n=1 Tax=Panagrolaimus davidi TaxID=227884 RepID=A0A914P785_9BILA
MNLSVASFKKKRSFRPRNREVIDAAVVDLDGIETNLSDLSRAELNRLLLVNRQRLGNFPNVPEITSNHIVVTLEAIIMKAFRECKFALFTAILASYLLTRNSLVKSFMPPMGIQFRKNDIKSTKLKLNDTFVRVFKYYALYFGGCVFDGETQLQWLENLRGRFNAKVDHMRSKDSDVSSYITFPDHLAPFNDDNAF